MAPRVLLQAGHSALYAPYATGGGGAPAEAEWTARLVGALSTDLRARGIDTVCLGSWMSYGVAGIPPTVAHEPYDLFIAAHYDAAIYGGGYNTGGFADRYRPENYGRTIIPARHLASVQADAFIAEWEGWYFPSTGIPNATQRRNANTNDYYAFRGLAESTPAVLIEFGIGAPGVGLNADLLWNRLDVVVGATANAVARNLADRGLYAIPPVPEPDDMEAELRALLPDPPITRAQALRDLQQLGFGLPEGFRISELMIKDAMLGCWRGPVISDEYPFTMRDGRQVVRRDCTGGSAEYDPSTSTASWVEVIKEQRQ